MDADGVGVDGDLLAGDGGDLALSDHADGAGDGLVLVVDHRAGLGAGHQGAVRLIGPVGEDLAGGLQAHLLAGLQHLAARQTQQDHVLVHAGDGLCDGQGQVHVLTGHVVQSAVGFYVLELHAVGGGEGQERAHLVLDVGLGLLGGADHVPPSEAHQVGEAGVRAYSHTGGLTGGHSLVHDQGVSGVIAAGHVGGGDVGNHVAVQTDGVSAEALTQVAVQIYLVHNESTSFIKLQLK